MIVYKVYEDTTATPTKSFRGWNRMTDAIQFASSLLKNSTVSKNVSVYEVIDNTTDIMVYFEAMPYEVPPNSR